MVRGQSTVMFIVKHGGIKMLEMRLDKIADSLDKIVEDLRRNNDIKTNKC